jgi:hypothetical protein
MGIYNVSLSGKYISILPPLCLSIPIDPNVASSLRHPHEHEQAKRFNWQALANAFEPIDFVGKSSPSTKVLEAMSSGSNPHVWIKWG